jgi:hypothetical protein
MGAARVTEDHNLLCSDEANQGNKKHSCATRHLRKIGDL